MRNGSRTRTCVHAGFEVRSDGSLLKAKPRGKGRKKSFESGSLSRREINPPHHPGRSASRPFFLQPGARRFPSAPCSARGGAFPRLLVLDATQRQLQLSLAATAVMRSGSHIWSAAGQLGSIGLRRWCRRKSQRRLRALAASFSCRMGAFWPSRCTRSVLLLLQPQCAKPPFGEMGQTQAFPPGTCIRDDPRIDRSRNGQEHVPSWRLSGFLFSSLFPSLQALLFLQAPFLKL